MKEDTGKSQQRKGRMREERKEMNEQTLTESNEGVREELRVRRESRAGESNQSSRAEFSTPVL